MNTKVGQKVPIGAPENEKERAPIVPDEGTLKEFGTKLLTTSWKKLKREYYIYDGKLYVVFSKEWKDLVKERVKEVDLKFLEMDINLVRRSTELKIKGGWEA